MHVTLQENNGVVRLNVLTGELTFYGLGMTSHPADLTNGGGYVPTADLVAFREPDGIALDQTGRFFVTANEGDTRNGAGSSGFAPAGARSASLIPPPGRSWAKPAPSWTMPRRQWASIRTTAATAAARNRKCLDLTHYRGFTLVAVGLERANAVALIDVSDPTHPTVISIVPVDVGPEGIKFFRKDNELFVAVANEVSGTVSILEVVF